MGDVQFVGDHDDGHALVVELLEHAHDLDAGAAVEIAGRLVGEQQGGLVGERAGDGDALLLAAGKLVRLVVGAVGQADRVQRLQGPLALARSGQALAGVEHRQFDILQRGGAGQQVEALEDEADLLVADVGQFVAAELRDVDAVERILPPGRPVEAADDVHHGGLAGAAGAHERDELALGDFQRHAAHGVHIHLAGVVGLVDVLELNDGVHGRVDSCGVAGCGAQTTTSPGPRRRTPPRRWQPSTARRASATARRPPNRPPASCRRTPAPKCP